MDYFKLTEVFRDLALQAGDAIMEIYLHDNIAIETKIDASPVTNADKTADSIKEIIKEFDYYLGDQPIRYDELEKAKSSKTLRLPGRFETLGSLLGGMINIVQYDRSLNYLDELSSLYSEPTLEEVQNTARKYLKPNQWSWLIVGDLKEIESEVRALNLGEVEIISN